MKKYNLFISIIGALCTLTSVYFAFTKPYINPLSITMIIVLSLCITIIHIPSKHKGDK